MTQLKMNRIKPSSISIKEAMFSTGGARVKIKLGLSENETMNKYLRVFWSFLKTSSFFSFFFGNAQSLMGGDELISPKKGYLTYTLYR